MKKWLTKELADMVGISVRTLHYYDKVGLLVPSCRQDNQYRLYSEKDLATLQQIIALKFFGFELKQIKTLLSDKTTVLQQLNNQIRFLNDKAQRLVDTANLLEKTMTDCSEKRPPSWEDIVQSIEVYNMTMQLEDSWVKEIFNQQELQQYAEFEAKMKKEATPESKKAFEDGWYALVDEIKANLNVSPTSAIGCELGGRCMEMINRIYGKEYAHLRTKKFEQGFGEGKGLEEHGLTPDIVAWLDKAMECYWRSRVGAVFAKINQIDDAALFDEWQDLMDEMYGCEDERKLQLIKEIMVDEEISQFGKDWLKRQYSL